MNFFFQIARKLGFIILLPLLTAILILSQGCEHSGNSLPDKDTTLTPDERYIVQLYVKINELEKNLQDNPSDSLKKWEALKEDVDKERILGTIKVLKKNPERWHAVFSRIELLMERERP